MYVTNGWAGLVLIPALAAAGLVVPTVLLLLGGVVYTAGALGSPVVGPPFKPTVFSYHEVWHLCTLTAAGAHSPKRGSFRHETQCRSSTDTTTTISTDSCRGKAGKPVAEIAEQLG